MVDTPTAASAPFSLEGATLFGSPRSPFVRMVRIALGELGLMDGASFVDAPGTPLDPPGERARQPLRKIPFLALADGAVVHDSRVIVEAGLLAAESAAPGSTAHFAPQEPAKRIEALTRQALFVGVCDVAVALAYERNLRPAELHWPEWHAVQLGKIDSALDWATAAARNWAKDRFDLGDCALYAALVYLDVRYPERDWRANRAELAAFFDAHKDRASVRAAA